VTGIGVRATGLTKTFRRYQRPRDRLLEWLSLGSVTRHAAEVALEPLDLEVAPGQCLGIIGENGAGKSTLLKLISGVLHPTGGSVTTEGRVVSLLELGAGFRPELDGVANVFESGRLLGYHDGEIRPRLEAILAFAELGDRAHHPVRTYSSGMFVRLAFSLFAHLDPAIYIVDEALAVGDVFFQQKCFAFRESL
jgi:ABC-type polysaccharide/polyol phosphate transport system ATPase subunit